jgi:2-phospho-L-lactate/phosphoenolpyruvate guanylyltransferase
MTGWTAIVPIKPASERKGRLQAVLDAAERTALTERLLAHVLGTLRSTPEIRDVALLTDAPPPGWAGPLIRDEGRGLNAELDAARRTCGGRIVAIHADLPCLSRQDVAALIASSASGIAIAPDRHDTGTNALALAAGVRFDFAFGAGSFQRHRLAAGARGTIVRRPGLAFDLDTPDDLADPQAAALLHEMQAARAPGGQRSASARP